MLSVEEQTASAQDGHVELEAQAGTRQDHEAVVSASLVVGAARAVAVGLRLVVGFSLAE